MNDFEMVRYWLPDFPDDWEFDQEEAGDPRPALDRIEAEATTLRNDNDKYGRDMNLLMAENGRMREHFENLGTALLESRAEVARLRAELAETRAIQEMDEKYGEVMSDESDDLKREVERLRSVEQHVEWLESQNVRFRTEVERLRAQLAMPWQEQQDSDRVNELEAEVERLRARIQSLETYIRNKTAEAAGGWTLPADVQIEYGNPT